MTMTTKALLQRVAQWGPKASLWLGAALATTAARAVNDLAERARAKNKPVIAYKIGRSEQGDSLAQSHTGALAGNDVAVDAFLRAHGVMRVRNLETLFELAPLAQKYLGKTPPHPTPARVAVITTT